MQPLGKFDRGLVRLGDDAQPVEQLLPRLHGVEGDLHLRRQFQHFIGNVSLGLGQLCRGDPLAQRQHEQIEKILRD
jgi:hypothetical protein